MLVTNVVYLGCPRCDGLFQDQQLYSQHITTCEGDRQKSVCELFACPKELFLQICSSQRSLSKYFPERLSVFCDAALNCDEKSKNYSNMSDEQVPALCTVHETQSTDFRTNSKNVEAEIRTLNAEPKAELPLSIFTSLDSSNHHLVEDIINTCTNPTDANLTQNLDSEEEQQCVSSTSIKLPDDNLTDTNLDCLWDLNEKDGHRVFTCKLCSHDSHYLGHMKRHVQAHNNGEELKCDSCDFTTIWRSRMKTHKLQHQQPLFLCELCSQQFKSQSSLSRHNAKKHKGKTNFQCPYGPECQYVAVCSSNLRDHIRKHTGEQLACNVGLCKFVTKFEKALALHKAKHQGITRFVCEICGYKTIESGSFKRHNLRHTGKKLFKCPDCPYKAVSKHTVEKHIYGKHVNYKRYACKKCNFTTAYYSGLAMHLMVHEGIKPYKCSLCSYRSNLSTKVRRHCSQKHVKSQAEVIKVENCLKFDVRDYLNPNVTKMNVKVIELSKEGEEELDEMNETETAPVALSSVLDTSTKTPSGTQLPPVSGDSLQDLPIMDGGFGLSSDPTFQLEDSDSMFNRRGRLDSTSSLMDFGKTSDSHRVKLPYLDSPDTSFQMASTTDHLLADFSQSLDSMKMRPFKNIGMGMRSSSMDDLTQLRLSCVKPSEWLIRDESPEPSFTIPETRDLDSAESKDAVQPEPAEKLACQDPLMLSISLAPSVDLPSWDKTPRQLKSLLSPDILQAVAKKEQPSFVWSGQNLNTNTKTVMLKVAATGDHDTKKTAILSFANLDS